MQKSNCMEKISVIVPVYKVEKFLDQCVSSIVNQSYKNLEIILVDDGSPDNCPAMCDGWAERDNRIKVIHKENGGLSSARNAGIDAATGDFIGFVDSDDYIDKRMYEQLLASFSNDRIGIVSCGVQYDKNGVLSVYNEKWTVKTRRVISYSEFPLLLLQAKANFTVWSKLYKRELFDNVRFKEGKLNEDSLFIFDISFELEREQLNMLEIPFDGYVYRYTEGSITNNRKKPLAIDIIENYDTMSNLAYLRNHVQIGKVTKKYRNYKLFWFLFKIMKTPDYHHYFNTYYQMFKNTSIVDIIVDCDLGAPDMVRLMLLRFYPRYYISKYGINTSKSL